MKIGFVSTWFERGATQVTLSFIEALKAEHEICVYARGGDEFPIDDPKWNLDFVHWGEFVPGARSTYIDRRDFVRWLKREKVDILIFNEQQSWDVILFLNDDKALKKAGVARPLLAAYIDYYTDETVPFFNFYDLLICNTKRHFSVFKNHPGAVLVPWALNVDRFPSSAEVHRPVTFFHSLGYNPQRKGTDLLVRAFLGMKNQDARLVLHAQRPLSDFPELEAMVRPNGRMEWLNQEVAPPGLYHLGDVYVYPSRLDGIGLSLPEALASGLPALTTDEAPMNEFVEDGVNGYLINVMKRWKRPDNYFHQMAEIDISHLTQLMDEIALDPQKLSEFKKRTREDAQRRFNFNAFSRLLNDVVMNAANHRQNPELSPELIDDCRKYEAISTPPLTYKTTIHRLLIALGFRQIKRAIFRRG